MNRIILIGNGFDLAHGLPTRYEDFINWYWDQWGRTLYSSSNKNETDQFCSFRLKESVGVAGWYLVWQWHYQQAIQLQQLTPRNLVELVKNDNNVCEFKLTSLLFSQICKSIETKGWVDIENEYYSLLKECFLKNKDNELSADVLNSHLSFIQNLLIRYLLSITGENIHLNPNIKNLIYQPINFNDIAISSKQTFFDHCDVLASANEGDWLYIMRQYGLSDTFLRIDYNDFIEKNTYQLPTGGCKVSDYSKIPSHYIRPYQVMLLSFNYTPISDWYNLNGIGFTNHIHGNLSQPDNIVFGYGDELDEDYNKILRLNNNEFLKHIKSMRYLETPNYRRVLDFIESAPYQIYIMGHSCGNSDRTLLNTLFEHRNCVTIKPFYHKRENGSDNYMEIIQNISRNFTDMKLMRDRIVNKTFCEPLPQLYK